MTGKISLNGETTSYYGRPVIKPPSWKAYVPAYFFTGGMAGASATLALVARVRGNDALARAALLGATGSAMVSPVLLIADLRDAPRFMNMFRMFKVTSPMSVGSWALGAFAGFCAAASASELSRVATPLGRAAEVLAGLIGPFVSTYTAALIANTAVPVWHDAYEELPFVFAGGSINSAAALAMILTPVEHAALARRLAFAGTVMEAAGIEMMHVTLGKLLAEPYRRKRAKLFKQGARASTIAGIALLRPARKSRRAATLCGALFLAGALCERFSVFEAGKQSAEDPKYTVQPQRERLERQARQR